MCDTVGCGDAPRSGLDRNVVTPAVWPVREDYQGPFRGLRSRLYSQPRTTYYEA